MTTHIIILYKTRGLWLPISRFLYFKVTKLPTSIPSNHTEKCYVRVAINNKMGKSYECINTKTLCRCYCNSNRILNLILDNITAWWLYESACWRVQHLLIIVYDVIIVIIRLQPWAPVLNLVISGCVKTIFCNMLLNFSTIQFRLQKDQNEIIWGWSEQKG